MASAAGKSDGRERLLGSESGIQEKGNFNNFYGSNATARKEFNGGDDTAESAGTARCAETCNPFSFFYRAVILAFACLLTFGSYFAYDNPASMTKEFTDVLCRGSQLNYGWMYSVYSLPNTVLPFIGGWIIDNYLGLRSGAVLFCAIIFLGSAIVAFASNLGENSASDAVGPFAIAIVGRFVFGLGGESLTVAQNAIVARWFKSHSLATAFAICVSFSRVGSATNFIIERPIVSQWGFPVALWTSAVFCAVSALAGVLLWFLDRRGERVRAVEKADLSGDDVALGKVTEVLQIDHILLYLICVAFYVAVFVFVQVAAVFFQLKYDISKADASIAVGIPYTVSAILSPFLGFIIDKLGYSLQLVVFACLNLAGFHLSLYYLDIPPIASMVWLGATYSVAAASIWPMVALIVEEDTLATAYGLMTAIQNLGLAVAPLISGMILEGSGPLLDKYLRLELLFTGCAIFAVILCLILGIVDSRRDGILISSSKEVEKIRACKVKAKSSTALHPEEIIISPRTHTTLRTNYLRLLNIQHTYQGSR